ncbi:MAG: Gmad2 immunoglobulin-like domain-containing protein [Patescibacteria group bacterium]
MTKFGKLLVIVGCLVFLGVIVFFLQRTPATTVIEDNLNPNLINNYNTNREMLGNTADLINFSILPNTKVSGIKSYRGSIKGGYFFEANILINILDANKNVLKKSNAMATSEWMTAGPISFEGNIDFTGLPKGQAYFEIHNDNASGLPENDKSILIPIIIE